jgi:transcriptional regulator with XRE-family HTH domain
VDDRPARERGAALGRRLRLLRSAAGLDPAELAEAAGLDPVSYRRAEDGDPATLTYLDLLALADVLAVPPASLLADPE